MATITDFTEMAARIGDPACAVMLHALMDGRALTAVELATVAGMPPRTASTQLDQLVEAELLVVEKQGRHRYFRLALAASQVKPIIEAALVGCPPAQVKIRTGPRDAALRMARTCYGHIAGILGVALCDALVAAGYVEIQGGTGAITEAGHSYLGKIGIDLDSAAAGKRTQRVICRPCLDWSERRPHLAGIVGRALHLHASKNDWIRRVGQTRTIHITRTGHAAWKDHFGVEITL